MIGHYTRIERYIHGVLDSLAGLIRLLRSATLSKFRAALAEYQKIDGPKGTSFATSVK